MHETVMSNKVPLPDKVVEALNKLAMALREHGLKLEGVSIKPERLRPIVNAYLLSTPAGVVAIKQEM